MAGDTSFFPDASEAGSINRMLNEYDPYIYALAQRSIPHRYASIDGDGLLDLEVDEIAQRSRIKLWHALEKHQVAFPRTYIRRIVYSECVDLARQRKAHLPLPVDDDGELCLGGALIASGMDAGDPESIIEQEEQHSERLKELVNIVKQHLTRQQKQAFLYGLKEKIDDVEALDATLADQSCLLEDDGYAPVSRAERRSWQASCSQARRKIARYMQLDAAALACG
jgi:DNA-directed RNA polymerase specialized sigma24 family protein